MMGQCESPSDLPCLAEQRVMKDIQEVKGAVWCLYTSHKPQCEPLALQIPEHGELLPMQVGGRVVLDTNSEIPL